MPGHEEFDQVDLRILEALQGATKATASSGGTAEVNATGKMDASASSGGTVRTRGSYSEFSVHMSSGGSVEKGK